MTSAGMKPRGGGRVAGHLYNHSKPMGCRLHCPSQHSLMHCEPQFGSLGMFWLLKRPPLTRKVHVQGVGLRNRLGWPPNQLVRMSALRVKFRDTACHRRNQIRFRPAQGRQLMSYRPTQIRSHTIDEGDGGAQTTNLTPYTRHTRLCNSLNNGYLT